MANPALGFVVYACDGHVDLLYTTPDAVRRGYVTLRSPADDD